jgi:dTDP-4-amino-4,6-dideoxygalactose transaminase
MSDPKPDPIYVTRPSLPPLDEFVESLREIWDNRLLTNNGPFHQRFEAALAEYLGVPYVSLFCNGTMALQVGLQALEISGEIITPPYSFPATTHAIHWNHCTPVFCDIEPDTCNLDPAKIEALITPKTTCLLPVHVYGSPCDANGIRKVASRHGLKVLYDAAHAFGVKLSGESILNFGDLSMLSFHATKVFNTIEGGALVTDDPDMKRRIDHLKNFGFAGETSVVAPGTNGKMNELQAAYGLLQLKTIDAEIAERRRLDASYREMLTGIPGIQLLPQPPKVTPNGAYFPIFVDESAYGCARDELHETLKAKGYFGRRYFYPLISSFAEYCDLPSAAPARLPEAVAVSERVLCLPMYSDLPAATVTEIAEVVRQVARAVVPAAVDGAAL